MITNYEFNMYQKQRNSTLEQTEKSCSDCKWYGIFTCECPHPCNVNTKDFWEEITKESE